MDLNGVWASLELPVDDHRLLRPGVLAVLRPRARPRHHPGVQRLGATRSGGSRTPTGSSRSASPGSPTPSSARRRSAATPSAAFRAVTLPERPHQIGLPSIFDEHWEPILEACAETDTVVCLHVGSSGIGDVPPGAPGDHAAGATLFGQLSLQAVHRVAVGGLAVRFPDLKVAMAEGGIGWVAMLLDRLDNIVDRSGYGHGWPTCDPPTCCAATSGSAPSTTRRPSTPATPSGRPHHGGGRLPARRQHLARHPRVIEEAWGHLPDDELRLMTTPTRPRSSGTRCPRSPGPDTWALTGSEAAPTIRFAVSAR